MVGKSIIAGVAFLFGGIIGSFLNVCIYRLPLSRSVVTPRSRCGHCQVVIAAHHNIPILSYFILRGRCAHCGYPFSIRYAIIEMFTAVLAALVFGFYGLSWLSVALFVFLAAMLVVTVVDLDHRIIPDEISLGGLAVGLLAAWVVPIFTPNWFVSPINSWFGAILGGGLFWVVGWVYHRLTQQHGIGLGDVKLLAMIGAWFGWQLVVLTIFFSSLLGSLYGVLLMMIRQRSSRYPIPFGPFIVIGCVLSLWLGDYCLQLLLNSQPSWKMPLPAVIQSNWPVKLE